MRKYLRWKYMVASIATTLIVVACSETARHPISPESGGAEFIPASPSFLNTPGGTVAECLEDVVEDIDGTNSVPLNCTANDVRLFLTVIGGGALPVCEAGSIIPSVDMEGRVVANAADRWDIGIWIAADGGNALRNVNPATPGCRHWSLVPTNTTETPAGDSLRLSPFYNEDGDSCGDLEQGVTNIVTPITLTNLVCSDSDQDGFLDVGSCVAWDNNGNSAHQCTDANAAVGQTRPNTKSKCKCEPIKIPVRIAGKIIVEKQTIPDGDPAEFDFTGQRTGTIGDGDTLQVLVEPGTYTMTETAKTGWTLTSISCSDSGQPTDSASTGVVGTRTATYRVGSGETVKCTFTNTKQATMILKKVMVGGTATFAFTGTGPNGSISANNGTITVNNVTPGQYTSTETPLAGWNLTALSCDDGASATPSTTNLGTGVATYNVEAGETVTCTYTNTKLGTMILKKVMVGGTATFAFTGTGPSGSIDTNNGTITVNNVVPGTYTSTETPLAGWDLTGLSCDDGASTTPSTTVLGTGVATYKVDPGETVTCTYTNTKRGVMILKKVMVGGTATFAFTGTGPSGSIDTNNGTITVNNVVPGTYTSTETPLAGWALTALSCDDGASATPSTTVLGTGVATYKVDPGETVTCTYTNTKGGQVIVKKVMIGGTATFAFTGTPNGSISANNGTISQAVTPGQYLSTETPLAGWNLTALSCDDGASTTPSTTNLGTGVATFNVEAGEVVTCTFTNTKQGQMILKKVMVGGTATFAFTGTGPSGSISVNNGTITVNNVVPGTYTSTETPLAGWDLTGLSCDDGASTTPSTTVLGTGVATYKVDPGETVTCTYTNTKQGQMILKKVMVGGTATFAFTGTGPSGSISVNNGTLTVNNVVPGTYNSTETPLAGWDLTGLSCDDGASATPSTVVLGTGVATYKVDPGEVVTCTYTNTKRGQMILKKVMVGGTATFAFTGTGPNGSIDTNNGTITVNNVIPGTYTSTETPLAGWQLTALACDDGASATPSTVVLGTGVATYKVDAGEIVTCTYTNTKLGIIVIEKEVVGGGTSSWTFSRSKTSGGGSDNGDNQTPTLQTGQNSSSGRKLTPGTYKVCETNVPVAFNVTATGYTLTPEGTLNNDYCTPIVINAGDSVLIHFVNAPPPGGGTRTIGYWKNWSSCARGADGDGKQFLKATAPDGIGIQFTLDGNIGAGSSIYPIGLITSLTCPEAVALLSKNAINGDKRAGDPIYNMVAQLLGAKLNYNAGSGHCSPVDTALPLAQQLLVDIGFNGTGSYAKNNSLTAQQKADALSYAGIFGSYNEGNGGPGCPGHV